MIGALLNRWAPPRQEPEDYVIFEAPNLLSPHHTVLVRSFLLGQYRIQLTDKRQPDDYAPEGHGTICRELCTYEYTVALATVLDLQACIDPEAHCEALAKPWNCEYPGGRIRLDNRPKAHHG